MTTIDLSKIIDSQTEFPKAWKTIARELLLKMCNGGTYHHENIAGCRPYTVDLTISIDDCVGHETDKRLHDDVKKYESAILLYHEVFIKAIALLVANDLVDEDLKKDLVVLGKFYNLGGGLD